MTEYESCTLWANSLVAAATFLAVLVALFGERLRQHWTRPKLVLHLEEPAFTSTNSGHQGWYYLLRVANERRSSPATNTRILLMTIQRKAPDGSWQPQRFSGPTQVTWRWPDMMPLYATVGHDESATFGFLREDNSAFQLSMVFYPNNLPKTIPANEPTRLVFQAVSDIAVSAPITVEVAWDGTWVAGLAEIRQHLMVKVVPA